MRIGEDWLTALCNFGTLGERAVAKIRGQRQRIAECERQIDVLRNEVARAERQVCDQARCIERLHREAAELRSKP